MNSLVGSGLFIAYPCPGAMAKGWNNGNGGGWCAAALFWF